MQWAIRTLAVTVTWDPPGGGWWQLEEVHVRGWQPRVFQERAPEAFKLGFRASAERYGLPIDYLDVRFVNDHCYARMRAVGAPEPKRGKSSSTPPAVVLKVLSRVHPGLRRRARNAVAALAERRWHADRRRWEAHDRGAMLAAGRALQAEPIESFDDDALLDHLRRVGDHFARGARLHFELVPVHNVPVGRFLLACRGWAISDGDAMALLAGSSRASAGSTAVLAQIAAACREAGVEPTSLDAVRSAGAQASVALEDYLADHAWRMVTQYTPRGLALIEMPDVLLLAIQRAEGPTAVAPPDPAPIRARVSEAERDRFDELLADARDCYGNRDDNVALTFMWPVGLMRRALLEVGRRLTNRRTIEASAHALALGTEELAAALHGEASMSEEAATRMQRMVRCEAEGAPAFIGDPEGDPPDTSVFPAAMAEVTAATMAVFELEGLAQAGPAGWSGTGVGIGNDRYEGRACVAASPEEALARLEPGDVLVTSLTTPAYEAIMAIAGAVVTEHGGLASHTALVAREQGIPAVVGVVGATATISSGALVVVDPAAGRVTVSPRPALT
jgi:pyruvate,water dikinase